MGQGTESCQGYEVDYDPYDELMVDGEWTTRGGGTIHVSKMSLRHLRNARQLCVRNKHEASFTDQEEKWQAWIELFDAEIDKRDSAPSVPKAPKTPPKPVRGTKVALICHCGQEYNARQADIKRGQGLSCSKRCAAIRREYGRPPATRK